MTRELRGVTWWILITWWFAGWVTGFSVAMGLLG